MVAAVADGALASNNPLPTSARSVEPSFVSVDGNSTLILLLIAFGERPVPILHQEMPQVAILIALTGRLLSIRL